MSDGALWDQSDEGKVGVRESGYLIVRLRGSEGEPEWSCSEEDGETRGSCASSNARE